MARTVLCACLAVSLLLCASAGAASQLEATAASSTISTLSTSLTTPSSCVTLDMSRQSLKLCVPTNGASEASAAGPLPTTQEELLAAGAVTCKHLGQRFTSAASAALVPSGGVTECFDGTALVSGAQAIWSHLVCCPADAAHTSSTAEQSTVRRLLGRRDRRNRSDRPGGGVGSKLTSGTASDGNHDSNPHEDNGRRLLGRRDRRNRSDRPGGGVGSKLTSGTASDGNHDSNPHEDNGRR